MLEDIDQGEKGENEVQKEGAQEGEHDAVTMMVCYFVNLSFKGWRESGLINQNPWACRYMTVFPRCRGMFSGELLGTMAPF